MTYLIMVGKAQVNKQHLEVALVVQLMLAIWEQKVGVMAVA